MLRNLLRLHTNFCFCSQSNELVPGAHEESLTLDRLLRDNSELKKVTHLTQYYRCPSQFMFSPFTCADRFYHSACRS